MTISSCTSEFPYGIRSGESAPGKLALSKHQAFSDEVHYSLNEPKELIFNIFFYIVNPIYMIATY
jgi:hypothetical protein